MFPARLSHRRGLRINEAFSRSTYRSPTTSRSGGPDGRHGYPSDYNTTARPTRQIRVRTPIEMSGGFSFDRAVRAPFISCSWRPHTAEDVVGAIPARAPHPTLEGRVQEYRRHGDRCAAVRVRQCGRDRTAPHPEIANLVFGFDVPPRSFGSPRRGLYTSARDQSALSLRRHLERMPAGQQTSLLQSRFSQQNHRALTGATVEGGGYFVQKITPRSCDCSARRPVNYRVNCRATPVDQPRRSWHVLLQDTLPLIRARDSMPGTVGDSCQNGGNPHCAHTCA